MMNILKKLHIKALISSTLAAITLLAAPSCNAIYDDLPECTSGAKLRFIYDYNMDYANAFMHYVECLTVYIYDADGKYVTTRTVNGAPLADENYRMTVDLPAGHYRAVAYGGIGCNKASFSHPGGAPSQGSPYTSLSMLINPAHLEENPGEPMHDLFWGTVEFSISETLGQYTEATVEMIRDTNNVRIVLQHVSGKPVDPDAFKWEITDDNTLMAHDNKVVSNGIVTYHPWVTGTTTGGYMSNGDPIIDAYAEFSLARLVTENGFLDNTGRKASRLRITRVKDGKEALSIYLIDALLQVRSDLYSQMPNQEYLDRESRWSLLFLLNENDTWYDINISINDWTVRYNDIEQ